MGLSGGGEGVTPVVLGRGMRGLAERAGRGGWMEVQREDSATQQQWAGRGAGWR